MIKLGRAHSAADERDGEVFFGAAANRAARIMSAAHGDQILLSSAAAELVRLRLPDGATLVDLGSIRLRDLARPERVYQLLDELHHPRH